MHSIRGTRYCYEVIKKVDNIPGFAPESYNVNVCDVVVKFQYIQFSDNPPNVITIEEIKEITECAERGFLEEDFNAL